MSSALLPLQGALVGALKTHPGLSALVSGVYDSVPASVERPYVTVGSFVEGASDAHNQRGRDVFVSFHIWSDYPGNAQAARILSEVCNALDRQNVSVPGWTHVSVALTEAVTVPDPDPNIRHINVSFRVWLTEE